MWQASMQKETQKSCGNLSKGESSVCGKARYNVVTGVGL